MELKSVTVEKQGLISEIALRQGIGFNQIKKILRKKDVKVNGVRTNKDICVNKGDKLDFYLEEIKKDLSVLYQDENLIVCNKEQGIESVDFYEMVKQKFPTAIFTHRLDRNTGGLIIFALNAIAYDELFKALKQRTIEKYYLAKVYGKMPKQQQALTAYCKKDAKNSFVKVYPDYKAGRLKIVTEYKVLNFDGENSLLEVKLVTGRTHQIRCHLAFVGNFILGDGKYGKEEINKKYKYKYQQLFAYKIIFNFERNSLLEYLNGKEIKLQIGL